MGKFSELDPAVKNIHESHINTRWEQLYELEREWGEKAIRYLLLTNSGGAIATLSFLGATEKALNLPGAKFALFLFLFGVFLVGVSTAKQFHHMSRLFKTWRIDVEQYFNDKLEWKHLLEEDEKRAKEDFWNYAIPYASFACFIGGCIAGALSLFK